MTSQPAAASLDFWISRSWVDELARAYVAFGSVPAFAAPFGARAVQVALQLRDQEQAAAGAYRPVEGDGP